MMDIIGPRSSRDFSLPICERVDLKRNRNHAPTATNLIGEIFIVRPPRQQRDASIVVRLGILLEIA